MNDLVRSLGQSLTNKSGDLVKRAAQLSLPKRLLAETKIFSLVLGVAVLLVSLFLVWQLSNVEFVPFDGSIRLDKAELRLETTPDRCLTPVRDRVVNDNLEASYQLEVWRCITAIHQAGGENVRTVKVPHEWRSDSLLAPELQGSGGNGVLYTSLFDVNYRPLPEDGGLGLWGLALTGAGHNVMAFLNGKMLGQGGNLGSPYARNHARPMMFSIPDELLVKGPNQFDIYVVSETPVEGFLGNAHIGPAHMLNDAHRFYHSVRFVTPQVISLSMLLLSGLMCLLWFYRRQDVEYLLLGLMSFFWSLHTLDQFVVYLPVPTQLWNWMVPVSFGALVVCSILFIHRFLEQQYPRAEKVLLLSFVVLASALWALPAAWLQPVVQYVWNPLLLPGAFYVSIRAIMQTLDEPNVELYALTLAVTVIFLLACHDQMLLSGLLPVYNGKLLHYGAPLLLLAFSWILLRRFVHSLRSAEQLNLGLRQFNQELEDRVAEKSQRIAKSYEMIRELGQERVVQEERSRIMRDMHDGIGVYLTSMLRQFELEPLDRKHLRNSAHNALNDLRLMIDSLGNASTDLPAMLGMFRTRIASLLEACQVELVWNVGDLPPVADFGPERALNLLRILQEAITNALKHSSAERIVLSAFAETSAGESSHIIIRIQDDGKGFAPQHLPGNGLKNMEHRARKINAGFALNSNEQGTVLTVTLPVV